MKQIQKRATLLLILCLIVVMSLTAKASATESPAVCQHAFSVIETHASSCTMMGKQVYSCGLCGYSYVDITTDALGHSWGEWVVTQEATSDTQGVKKRECSVCGTNEPRVFTQESVTASGTCGANLNWTLDAEGTLTISGYGNMYDYFDSNPPWYDYREYIYQAVLSENITYIGKFAFQECYYMTSVNIPYGIASIPNGAFIECQSLTAVEIPDTVKSIGIMAFDNCISLTDLKLSDNLTTIDMLAFSGCSSLTKLELPASLNKIGTEAFYGCVRLAQIDFPANSIYINENAFGCWVGGRYTEMEIVTPSLDAWMDINFGGYGANPMSQSVSMLVVNGQPLTDIVLPADMESLKNDALYGCGMASIVLPEGLKTIGARALGECVKLKHVDIPDSVTSIEERAFYYCEALETIRLPAVLSEIPEDAFYNCEKLSHIQIPDTVTAIGVSAFQNCIGLTELVLPDGVTSIGESAFYGCSGLTGITIPDGVQQLQQYVFTDCSSLIQVSLPEGLTSIGSNAFLRCTSLQEIDLPEGLTSIGNKAFYRCSSLTDAVIPTGITGIPSECFAECTALMTVTLPEGLTAIGTYAFDGCSALSELVLPDTVTSIGAYAFRQCQQIQQIRIPEGVSAIEKNTFYNCDGLETVDIPDSVVSIAEYAFNDCDALQTLEIPGSVISIGKGSFAGCEGLQSVTIQPGVTSIGSDAFSYCTGLASVSIPDTITEIGSEAFWSCASLTEVTLPEGITELKSYVFARCSALKEFTIPDSVTVIGAQALSYCSNLEQIVIPASVTTISGSAFAYCDGLELVQFLGDAPSIDSMAFNNVYANALYPEENPTWTEDVLLDYGGTIIWYPGDSAEDIVLSGSGTCGDNLSWNYSDGTLVITGSGAMYDYERNSAPWRHLTSGIRNIQLPDTLTTIGKYAFYACRKLESIVIPKNVVINSSAFCSCVQLSAVTLSEGVSFGSSMTFCHCPLLQTAGAVGTGCNVEFAWKNTIPQYAFADMDYLTTVTFPKGISYISYAAFFSCNSLKELWFCGDGPTFHAEALSQTTITGYYPSDASGWNVTIENGLLTATINWVMYDPETTQVPGAPDEPEAPDNEVRWRFDSSTGTLTVSGSGAIPDYGNSNGIPPWDSVWDDTYHIIIEEGITEVGEQSFYCFYYVKDISLPKTLVRIGRNAFHSCGITQITLPLRLEKIEPSAFSDCTSLQGLTIPAFVASIGDYAFSGCSALTEVYFTGDSPVIGYNAFTTGNFIDVYYPEGNDSWDTESYDNNIGWLRWKSYVHEHTWNEGEVIQEPTGGIEGIRTYTCTVCGISRTEAVSSGYQVTYTTASISLAGDIGVNYYAQLSANIVADEGAYMQFTVAGQTQIVPLSEAVVSTDSSGVTTYRFSCKVAAKQMTETIVGQMYLSDGTAVGEEKVYSVKAYCDTAIPAYGQYAAHADLVDLMEAMLNYGGYSQVQFGYNTANLANADLADTSLPAITADDVAAYAHGATGSESGISVASCSLLLESTTTIRFYFNVEEGYDIRGYTFYVDGVETTPVQSAENQYYVDKVNVAAKDLDEMATVTVGGLTVKYCGLSYVRQVAVLYPTYYSESLVNVAKALYAYNQAANAYFG